jgi:hypothetical protein
LSVDVQDQDLSTVVERIAELARIELRHPEGMPNSRVSIRFSSLSVINGLKRLFRTAEVPGYLLQTAKQGNSVYVQRIVFLPGRGILGPVPARHPASRRPHGRRHRRRRLPPCHRNPLAQCLNRLLLRHERRRERTKDVRVATSLTRLSPMLPPDVS